MYYSRHAGGWYCSRYDDLTTLFRDRRLSAQRLQPVFASLPAEEQRRQQPLADALSRWTLLMDPPDHTRIRPLIAKAFTPRLVERLAPRVEALVDRLLAEPLAAGRMDVVADLAYPLPATVIAALLGVPLEDVPSIKRWADDLAHFFGRAEFDQATLDRTRASVEQASDYLRDLIEARRKSPRDDLASGLLAAREASHTLSDEELIASCLMLIFAGHETTTNLIANGALCLVRHDDARRRLRRESLLIDSALEEILRFDGPVQRLSRLAKDEVQIDDQRIEAGSRVFLLVGAANRDPKQFTKPDDFDIARSPNRHLGFGHGAHFCIGASLGRLEARTALAAFVRFCRQPEIDGDVSWHDNLAIRALVTLPIRFR